MSQSTPPIEKPKKTVEVSLTALRVRGVIQTVLTSICYVLLAHFIVEGVAVKYGWDPNPLWWNFAKGTLAIAFISGFLELHGEGKAQKTFSYLLQLVLPPSVFGVVELIIHQVIPALVGAG